LSCLALIEWDDASRMFGPHVRRLRAGAVVIGFLLILAWPQVYPAPMPFAHPELLASLGAMLVGAAAGSLFGRLAWPATASGPLGRRGQPIALANLTLIGGALGTLAVSVLAATTALVYFAWTWARSSGWRLAAIPWSLVLGAIACVGAALQPWGQRLARGATAADTVIVVLGSAAAVAILSWGVASLCRGRTAAVEGQRLSP
jgi:hypothetical protein